MMRLTIAMLISKVTGGVGARQECMFTPTHGAAAP